MSENVSPEEKLLKLIRQQKKPEAVKSPVIKETANLPAPEPQKHNSTARSLRYPAALNARKVIFFLLGVSLVYLAIVIFFPFAGRKESSPPGSGEEKNASPVQTTEQTGDEKSLDLYLEGVKNRNVFSSSGLAAGGEEKPLQALTADLLKGMKLVGIMTGDSPQAIIEDSKAQKTYYLKEGQSLAEFQVTGIQDGKVILEYKGEKYELYL